MDNVNPSAISQIVYNIYVAHLSAPSELCILLTILHLTGFYASEDGEWSGVDKRINPGVVAARLLTHINRSHCNQKNTRTTRIPILWCVYVDMSHYMSVCLSVRYTVKISFLCILNVWFCVSRIHCRLYGRTVLSSCSGIRLILMCTLYLAICEIILCLLVFYRLVVKYFTYRLNIRPTLI